MPNPSNAVASGVGMRYTRVLIVEDRALVAGKIERSVRAAGYGVAGVVATVTAALAQLGQVAAPLDAAILDIDLRGEPVYPVAEKLRDRRVPFLFLTGYGRPAIDPRWAAVPRIEKPFEAADLARVLGALLTGHLKAMPEDGGPPLTGPVRRAWENLRKSRDIVTEARAWQETHPWPDPLKRR